MVLGWGSTADGQLSNNLREAVVQPVDRDVCQRQFNKFFSKVKCWGGAWFALGEAGDRCSSGAWGEV